METNEVLSYVFPLPDLVCPDEAGLTQLILLVQLVFLGQTFFILGLQRGNATLHFCKLFFGIIQDTLGGS